MVCASVQCLFLKSSCFIEILVLPLNWLTENGWNKLILISNLRAHNIKKEKKFCIHYFLCVFSSAYTFNIILMYIILFIFIYLVQNKVETKIIKMATAAANPTTTNPTPTVDEGKDFFFRDNLK